MNAPPPRKPLTPMQRLMLALLIAGLLAANMAATAWLANRCAAAPAHQERTGC